MRYATLSMFDMRSEDVQGLDVHGGYLTGMDLDRLADAVVPPEHWLDMGKLTGWLGDLAQLLVNGCPMGEIGRVWGISQPTLRDRIAFLGSVIEALRQSVSGDFQNLADSAGFRRLEPANSPASRQPWVSTSFIADPAPQEHEYASCSPRGLDMLLVAAATVERDSWRNDMLSAMR